MPDYLYDIESIVGSKPAPEPTMPPLRRLSEEELRNARKAVYAADKSKYAKIKQFMEKYDDLYGPIDQERPGLTYQALDAATVTMRKYIARWGLMPVDPETGAVSYGESLDYVTKQPGLTGAAAAVTSALIPRTGQMGTKDSLAKKMRNALQLEVAAREKAGAIPDKYYEVKDGKKVLKEYGWTDVLAEEYKKFQVAGALNLPHSALRLAGAAVAGEINPDKSIYDKVAADLGFDPETPPSERAPLHSNEAKALADQWREEIGWVQKVTGGPPEAVVAFEHVAQAVGGLADFVIRMTAASKVIPTNMFKDLIKAQKFTGKLLSRQGIRDLPQYMLSQTPQATRTAMGFTVADVIGTPEDIPHAARSGMAMGLAFGAIETLPGGKLLRELGKMSAEGATLGAFTYAQGGDATDILIATLIPPTMKSLRLMKTEEMRKARTDAERRNIQRGMLKAQEKWDDLEWRKKEVDLVWSWDKKTLDRELRRLPGQIGLKPELGFRLHVANERAAGNRVDPDPTFRAKDLVKKGFAEEVIETPEGQEKAAKLLGDVEKKGGKPSRTSFKEGERSTEAERIQAVENVRRTIGQVLMDKIVTGQKVIDRLTRPWNEKKVRDWVNNYADVRELASDLKVLGRDIPVDEARWWRQRSVEDAIEFSLQAIRKGYDDATLKEVPGTQLSEPMKAISDAARNLGMRVVWMESSKKSTGLGAVVKMFQRPDLLFVNARELTRTEPGKKAPIQQFDRLARTVLHEALHGLSQTHPDLFLKLGRAFDGDVLDSMAKAYNNRVRKNIGKKAADWQQENTLYNEGVSYATEMLFSPDKAGATKGLADTLMRFLNGDADARATLEKLLPERAGVYTPKSDPTGKKFTQEFLDTLEEVMVREADLILAETFPDIPPRLVAEAFRLKQEQVGPATELMHSVFTPGELRRITIEKSDQPRRYLKDEKGRDLLYQIAPKTEYLAELNNIVAKRLPGWKGISRALRLQEILDNDPRMWKYNPDAEWFASNKEYLFSVDPDTLCQRSEGCDRAMIMVKAELAKMGLDFNTDIGYEIIARASAAGLQVPCPFCYVWWKRNKGGTAQMRKYLFGVGGYDGQLARKSAQTLAFFRDYGSRHYSSTEFKAEHLPGLIVEMYDAMLKNVPHTAYTKVADYIRIFGNAGAYINCSTARHPDMSMDLTTAKRLRSQYKNVGVTYVGLTDAEILWALRQTWVDHVLPLHLSGQRGKEMKLRLEQIYGAADAKQMKDYTHGYAEHDPRFPTVGLDKLQENTGEPHAWRKVNEPEHGGDLGRYLQLCEERGVIKKFPGIFDLLGDGEKGLYMKLAGVGPEFGKFGGKFPYEAPNPEGISWHRLREMVRNRQRDISTDFGGYEKIARDIVSEIRKGVFTPGDTKPVVREGAFVRKFPEVKMLRQQRGQRILGETEFFENGAAIIRGFEGANFDTFAHEIAHPLRRMVFNREVPTHRRADVTDSDITAIEKFCGVKDGKWTEPAEEKFAEAFQRYLKEGNAPTSRLEVVFRKVAAFLKALYKSMPGDKLNPEVRRAFDHAFQRVESLKSKRMAQLRDVARAKRAENVDPRLKEVNDYEDMIRHEENALERRLYEGYQSGLLRQTERGYAPEGWGGREIMMEAAAQRQQIEAARQEVTRMREEVTRAVAADKRTTAGAEKERQLQEGIENETTPITIRSADVEYKGSQYRRREGKPWKRLTEKGGWAKVGDSDLIKKLELLVQEQDAEAINKGKPKPEQPQKASPADMAIARKQVTRIVDLFKKLPDEVIQGKAKSKTQPEYWTKDRIAAEFDQLESLLEIMRRNGAFTKALGDRLVKYGLYDQETVDAMRRGERVQSGEKATWEMTKEEYTSPEAVNAALEGVKREDWMFGRETQQRVIEHRRAVELALEAGRPVPKEVLRDYRLEPPGATAAGEDIRPGPRSAKADQRTEYDASEATTGEPLSYRIDRVIPAGQAGAVDLARELGAEPKVKEMRGRLARYRRFPDGRLEITLDPSVYWDTAKANAYMAHEIGHLLGDAYGLKKFFTDTLGAEIGRNKQIFDELWELSKWWTPADWMAAEQSKRGRGYIEYRRRGDELFAQAISVLLNAPNELKLRAPRTWEILQQALNRNDKATDAIIDLQQRLAGDPAEVRAARFEALKQSLMSAEEKRSAILQEMEEVDLGWQNRLRKMSAWAWSLASEDAPEMFLDRTYRSKNRVLEKMGDWLWLGYERGNARLEDIFFAFDEIHDPNSPVAKVVMDFKQWFEADTKNGKYKYEKADLDRYLELLRIAGGDRAGIANPDGLTWESALDMIQNELRPKYTEAQWENLQQVVRNFHDKVHWPVIVKAYEAGLISPEAMRAYERSKYYWVAFGVTDHMIVDPTRPGARHVVSKIYAQKGTHSKIGSPLDESLLKLMAIARATTLNRAKIKMVYFLVENEPLEAGKMRLKPDTETGETYERLNPGMGKITLIRNGVMEAWQVPKYMADAFETNRVGDVQRVAGAVSSWMYKIWHPLYVTYNPMFVTGNVVRDLNRTWRNLIPIINAAVKKQREEFMMKGGSAEEAAKRFPKASFLELLKHYKSAVYDQGKWGPAVDWAKGKSDPFIAQMIEDRGLTLPWIRSHHRALELEAQKDGEIAGGTVEDVYKAFGLKTMEEARVGLRQKMGAMLDGIATVGQITENMSKVAGYTMLGQYGITGSKRGYLVRKYVGTPHHTQRGAWSGITNALLMYSKVRWAGLQSDIRVLRNPDTRLGAGMRVLSTSIIPKALMFGILHGYLDDIPGMPGLRKRFEMIPNYYMMDYDVLPLWLQTDSHGNTKVRFITLPMGDIERATGRLFWETLEAIEATAGGQTRHKTGLEAWMELFQEGISEIKGTWIPPLDLISNWNDYMKGQNPYDDFYNKQIIPKTEWDAGGLAAMGKMFRWSVNKFGIVSSVTQPVFDTVYGRPMETGEDSTTEILTRWAGKMTGIGRFWRLTDAGLDERRWILMDAESQARAAVRHNAPNARALTSRVYELRQWAANHDLTPKEKKEKRIISGWFERTYRRKMRQILAAESQDDSQTAGRLLEELEQSAREKQEIIRRLRLGE